MLSFLRNLKSGEADGQQGHRSEHAGREVRHLGRLQDDAAHAHLARREQTIAHLLVQGDGRRQQRLHRVVERAVQDKHMQRPLAQNTAAAGGHVQARSEFWAVESRHLVSASQSVQEDAIASVAACIKLAQEIPPRSRMVRLTIQSQQRFQCCMRTSAAVRCGRRNTSSP